MSRAPAPYARPEQLARACAGRARVCAHALQGWGVPPVRRVPATTPKDSNPSACASRVRGDTLSQEAQ